MLRILIIDDEPAICRHIEKLISRYKDYVVIGTTGTLAEAKVLLSTTRPDIVLLDVELQDGTGFDLLQSLTAHPFQVIFITAYQEYALRAIKFGALDYLLKPVNEDELAEALARAAAAHREDFGEQLNIVQQHWRSPDRSYNRIVLRSQQYMMVATFQEILYCEGNAGYTTFHLSDNRKELVTKSLKEYEELLPGSWFIRTHQSYIVNHHYISKYHKDGYVVMKGGAEIPVATRKRDAVIRVLSE